jgi:hypothetical protein
VGADAACEVIAARARMLCNAGLAETPAIAAYEAVFMNSRREWSIFLMVELLVLPSMLGNVFGRSNG